MASLIWFWMRHLEKRTGINLRIIQRVQTNMESVGHLLANGMGGYLARITESLEAEVVDESVRLEGLDLVPYQLVVSLIDFPDGQLEPVTRQIAQFESAIFLEPETGEPWVHVLAKKKMACRLVTWGCQAWCCGTGYWVPGSVWNWPLENSQLFKSCQTPTLGQNGSYLNSEIIWVVTARLSLVPAMPIRFELILNKSRCITERSNGWLRRDTGWLTHLRCLAIKLTAWIVSMFSLYKQHSTTLKRSSSLDVSELLVGRKQSFMELLFSEKRGQSDPTSSLEMETATYLVLLVTNFDDLLCELGFFVDLIDRVARERLVKHLEKVMHLFPVQFVLLMIIEPLQQVCLSVDQYFVNLLGASIRNEQVLELEPRKSVSSWYLTSPRIFPIDCSYSSWEDATRDSAEVGLPSCSGIRGSLRSFR